MARTKTVAKKSTATTKKTATAPKKGSEDYDTMKVTELKELCKKRGLSASGLKSELIKRLKGKAEPPKKSKKAEVESEEDEASGDEEEEVENSSPESDGEDEGASSSEEEPEPPKKSKVQKKKAPAKEESEEEDDEAPSSEEEEPEPPKKSKVQKKKAPAKEESEDEDEEAPSSDEEEPEPPKKSKVASKKPAPKGKGKVQKKKAPAKEESEEENSSSEEPEPPKKSKVQPKGKSKVSKAKGKVAQKKKVQEEESEDEDVKEEPPKKAKGKVAKGKVQKKAPMKEETEESSEDGSSEDAESEPPKKASKKVKVQAEEEDSLVIPPELSAILDSDVDHYYVTPAELLTAAWTAVLETGGPNVDVSRVSQAFALISEKLRAYGLEKVHSVSAHPKAAAAIKGKVKPKPVTKTPVKGKVKTPPKEEDEDEGEDVASATEEAEPMVVKFDDELQVYRSDVYVFDQESKSVVGKILDGGAIIPLDVNDVGVLQKQDIRCRIVDSQEELDAILEANRKGDSEQEEGPSEGDDDGKEVKIGDDAGAVTNVEAGLDEMLERKAPEITEDMFKRFLNAQNACQNKVDYVAIAKDAGLSDMEGQEIMGNFMAYKDRFPTVVTEAVMKKTTVKTSLGAKKEVQPSSGRRMLKK